MKRLLILLILPVQMAFGQVGQVTLEECYKQARENYPKLSDLDREQQMNDLKTKNLDANWLPTVNLNGQATYQSDVTSVSVSLPGINIPTPSKDQYKVYIDLHQNIYDGGLTKAQKEVDAANLAADQQKLEVEMYSLNDRVNQLYFGIILMQKSHKVLELKKENISERLRVLESGLKNGMVQARNVETLRAEKILTDQQIEEVDAKRMAAVKSLAVLTGLSIGGNTQFQAPVIAQKNEEWQRPELKLYNRMENTIDKSAELISKTRNPKVFGFGQVGYGKPGLNMLKSEFSSYYLVGVGVKWNIFDWKQSRRKREVLDIQKQMVNSSRETFKQNVNMALVQSSENIQKLESLINTDQKLVSIRDKVAAQSASQLENGVITSADYVTDLNAEIQARINLESRKVQYLQAVANYNTLTGNLSNN
ncbi:TolC family protein [Prolixibacter denitrificans]|uniref:Outer membrane protein TolC n=1 Tax=Prolixibacter denitrificans TaxID=1541063 RepID=A0A2P8CJI7_9BACT|nr:TolC family protein [Prolixibacter denitrificans]PSK85129.1 outer membrane protein TolC [Prolixibacter denitrificans]GET23671.1 transporter [Prolixibacter denitrificans]